MSSGYLGVLHEDVKVTIVEHTRAEQLIFQRPSAVAATSSSSGAYGYAAADTVSFMYGVWRGVQIEVILFDVLAVVPFATCEAKESLLENGVAAIPKRYSKADGLMAIADATDSVLPPAIGF
jgi:hypothetical protein